MGKETVFITGASSGIGRELARCFAADGCRLILHGRRQQALEALARELQQGHGTETRILTAELADPKAPVRLHDECELSGMEVDVLVNNAGFGAHGKFADLPLERQLDMVQANVTALMHLTGLFLPAMIRRQRGGVLNVASTAAFQPGPGMAVYYATKAFVLSFSEALAEEVAGCNVTVTTLCPGLTETNFAAAANFQGSRLLTRGAMSAASVARYGHRAFRRGRVLAVPGLRNRLLVFSVRLGPRATVRKVVKSLNDPNGKK